MLAHFCLSLWMFASPVAYPLFALWGKTTIRPGQVLCTLALTLAPALPGTLLFNREERVFTDTIKRLHSTGCAI